MISTFDPTKDKGMMWTLARAQALISAAQSTALKCDYNLALGGGVLNNGSSNKDLDILAIPRSSVRKPKFELLLKYFTEDLPVEQLFTYADSEKLEGRIVYRFVMPDARVVDLIFVCYD
jgi:hypothetical protein